SNGRFGISIGHKDSDNLLANNTVRENLHNGVFFRNESFGMAGHRNRLVDNIIENNGINADQAGIRIRGNVNGLIFEGNIIRDTRPDGEKTQKTGILIEESVGNIQLGENKIEAETPIIDKRGK
ncbi:right-handed parallel beta-helix repeat-containing protein, partial [bacterium]|nr:right-handed parallel beta-helix repeat-containing protein [bacterium]